MSFNARWPYSELGKEAFNASRPFSFKLHPKVVFVNTGDVLQGKFLHSNISVGLELPGQAKKALKVDDILLTEIRPSNGRYAYVDFDAFNYVVSTKFMVIESYGRVKPRFLYHVLTNQFALDEFQRIAESRSGTFPQITFESIEHFPIPLPPLSAQDALIDFFDELDARISLLRETNATLEAIAQALFKSWFVDFDPVRAKSEGALPDGMDEATAALFPDAFDETEQGVVPRGWQVEALDDVAEFLNGLALQKFPPTGVDDLPVIKIAQLRKGDTVGADLAAGSIKPVYIIQNGDVLFSWSGSLEVEIWCGGIGALNQHLFKVTSSRFNKWFYYLWTKHHLESFRQIAASKATTMGHIQRGHLSSAKVNVPSEPVLKVADALFAPIVERIVHNALQANTLANLRDTLLPRLISGQLRIADAEAELEKVTA
jgi:type I restriction enzyme S subunit